MTKLGPLYRANRMYVILLLFIAYTAVLPQLLPFVLSEDLQQKLHDNHQHVLSYEEQEQQDIKYVQDLEEKLGAKPEFQVFHVAFSLGILLLCACGVLLWLLYLMFKIFSVDFWGIKSLRSSYRLGLNFGDFLRLLIVFLAMMSFVHLCIYAQSLWLSGEQVSHVLMGNLQMVFNALLMNLGFCIFVFYYMNSRYGQKPWLMGFHLKAWKSKMLFGFTAYVMSLPILFATLGLTAHFVSNFQQEVPPHPLVPMMLEEQSVLTIGFLILFSCVIGPVCEEIMFRGAMYPIFRKHIGKFLAAFFSSAIFSLLHMNLMMFVSILTLGFLLTYLYERTGSLVAPCCVHVAHNSLMMAIVLGLKNYL